MSCAFFVGLDAFDTTGGPNQVELLSLLEQFELRPSLSLQSSRAASERSLFGSLRGSTRHMHSASPSPQLQHASVAMPSAHYSPSSLATSQQAVTKEFAVEPHAERLQEDKAVPAACTGQEPTSAFDGDGPPLVAATTSWKQPVSPPKSATQSPDSSPPLLKAVLSTNTLQQFEYTPAVSGGGERSRAASLSGSSMDAASAAAAARAAMVHESPYLQRASSSVSSPSLPQHTTLAEVPAATVSSSRVSVTGHRRSSSVSLRRQSSTVGSVRHSFSAGEVSAPLRVGSVDLGSLGARLQDRNIALVRPSVQLMSDGQRSPGSLYSPLANSSVLDDRFISHC